MVFLYNIGLFAFAFTVKVAGLFHKKARQFTKGRRGLFTRLQQVSQAGAPVAWFHCASLGEFEQGRPLMEAYRNKYKEHKILLTFFSPSGYEVRKHYEGVDFVCYLPVDTPRNARRFVDMVNPVAVIFIKYEFWYNILHTLKQRQIPVYLVSSVFRSSQLFFKKGGGFFRNILSFYACLFVQDETSVKLLKSIGIENVVQAGDTRFDRVCTYTQRTSGLPQVKAFAGKAPTLVAGSTWPPDEKKLAEVWPSLPAGSRLIIAPHEIEERRLATLEKLFAAYRPLRYTRLGDRMRFDNTHVLIMDTIGMLSLVYRYGRAAYIGGGFGIGIHNVLEAAVYGIPVVFGPCYKKFTEACSLISLGGAQSFKHSETLQQVLHRWLFDNDAQQTAGGIAADYVYEHSGATVQIISYL